MMNRDWVTISVGRGGRAARVWSQAARAPGSAAMSWAEARVRSRRARKPPTTPSWPRTTKKPSGCRSHHRAAMAADVSPSHVQDEVQDRLPVPGRAGSGMAAPDVPVDRRQAAGKMAEQVLGVGDGALLLLPLGRLQAAADVAADRAEHPLVALGVAPAQVGLQGVAGQVVREQTLRSGLHEGQLPQPGEQLVRVLQLEHLPQQGLGGHPGQRAHLQGTAMPPSGTTSTNRRSRVPTRSGVSGSAAASPPRTTTSASSDSPSGWPWASSTSWSWRAGSTPQACRYRRLPPG